MTQSFPQSMSQSPLKSGASLENLKKHAKTLLKQVQAGDSDAIAVCLQYFDQSSTLGLQNCQLVLAREYGFESWIKLTAFVPNLGKIEDRHTMRFSRVFERTSAQLWPYLIDPEHLRNWYMETSWDYRVGGRFSFKFGWEGVIEEIQPEVTIAFRADEGGLTRFLLEPVGTGCRFSIIDSMRAGFVTPDHLVANDPPQMTRQPGGPGTHWIGIITGWHGFVDSLEQYVTGKEMPEAFADEGLVDTYSNMIENFHNDQLAEDG